MKVALAIDQIVICFSLIEHAVLAIGSLRQESIGLETALVLKRSLSEGSDWEHFEEHYEDELNEELDHLSTYGEDSEEASGWQNWWSWGPVGEWRSVTDEVKMPDCDESQHLPHDSSEGHEEQQCAARTGVDSLHVQTSRQGESSRHGAQRVSKGKTSLISSILNRPAMPIPAASSHAAGSSANILPSKPISRAAEGERNTLPARTKQASKGNSSREDYIMEGLDEQAMEWRQRMDALNNCPEKPLDARTRHKKMREVLFEIWNARDITLDLLPQELALEMAKIKIEFGYAQSLGALASRTVQKCKDKDYFHRYQLNTKRYARRLSKLKCRLKEDARYFFFNSKEGLEFLIREIGGYKAKHYGSRSTMTRKSMEDDLQLDMTSEKVWNELMEIARVKLRRPDLKEDEITIKQVEKYSRDKELAGADLISTAEFLKRYMVRYLNKTEEEIEQFSINRLHYRYTFHSALKKEKEIKGRDSVQSSSRLWRKKQND